MFAPTSALICVLLHDGEFGVWDLDAQTLVAHTYSLLADATALWPQRCGSIAYTVSARRQRATVSHRSGSLRLQRRQGARAARDGAGARRAMASAGSAAGHLDSRAAGARTARARRAAEVYA